MLFKVINCKIPKKDWLSFNFQMINTRRQTLLEIQKLLSLQGWKQYFIKPLVLSK